MLVGRNFKKRYVVFRIVSHGAKRYFRMAAFRNREGGSQPPYKRRFFSIFLAAVWARNMVPVRHEDKGGHLMGVKFESQFVHWTPAFSAVASVGASASRRCPLDTRTPSLGFSHGKTIHWIIFPPSPELSFHSPGRCPRPQWRLCLHTSTSFSKKRKRKVSSVKQKHQFYAL